MDATFTAVLRLWEQQCSQKEIARRLMISRQKVKKILLTAGCINTDDAALAEAGKTIPEIMELTGKSQSAVCANLPYDKGMYGAEYPTINALRIRECRKRKKEEYDEG